VADFGAHTTFLAPYLSPAGTATPAAHVHLLNLIDHLRVIASRSGYYRAPRPVDKGLTAAPAQSVQTIQSASRFQIADIC
jgi:hypothetical protein